MKPNQPTSPTARRTPHGDVQSRWQAFTHNRAAVMGVTLLAAVLAAVLVMLLVRVVPTWLNQMPVEKVVFVGTLQEVDRADLEAIAEGLRTRNTSILRLDLAQLRGVMMKQEWVRDAQVYRRFPSTIEVVVEEHRPAALWAEVGSTKESTESASAARSMVNSYGEVFVASLDAAREAVLPQLAGPADAAADALEKYVALNAVLQPIERRVRNLSLSERRAWTATLDNATTLALGRQEPDARLERFVRAVQVVPALQGDALQVDLRYPTGLSLKGAPQNANVPSLKPTKATVTAPPIRKPAMKSAAETAAKPVTTTARQQTT